MFDPIAYLDWLVSLSWFDFGKAAWTGIGVCTGIFGAIRLNRWNLRSGNNFAALSQLTQSGSQATAYSKVMRFMIRYPGAGPIPDQAVEQDPAVEEQVLVMLGMYQFLAFSVEQELLDRQLVIGQFLPSMTNLTTRFRPSIDVYRDRLNRPQAWSELESFVANKGRRVRGDRKSAARPAATPRAVQTS